MGDSKMTAWQEQQRRNIRNAYLCASIKEIERARDSHMQRGDSFGTAVLQEMIDTCKKYGVDSFDKTPV